MPEKNPESATAAPGEKRSVSRPPLAKASESGDPAVHQILAEADIARRNGDAEQEQAALARLNKLGFE